MEKGFLFETQEEEKRFEKLIKKLPKQGKKILNEAIEKGYKLKFIPNIGCNGTVGKKSKTIAINPNISDEDVIGTMVHESKHALQYSKLKQIEPTNIKAKSFIMVSYAQEADAYATEAKICWLAKDKDKKIWESFAKRAPVISSLYEQEAKKGDFYIKNDFATMKAFLGFYANKKRVELYGGEYCDLILNDRTKNNCDNLKELSPEEIVKNTCFNEKQENYFKFESKFLEDERLLSVPSLAKFNLTKSNLFLKEKGQAVDDSINQISDEKTNFYNQDEIEAKYKRQEKAKIAKYLLENKGKSQSKQLLKPIYEIKRANQK